MIDCNIIRLSRDNYIDAMDLMPLDVAEELSYRTDYDGILMLADDEDGQVPVGVLISQISLESAESNTYSCTIRYIYVSEVYRREGIATRMLTDLTERLTGSNVAFIEAEFPFSMESVELESLFDKMGFIIDSGAGNILSIRLSDVNIPKPQTEVAESGEYIRLADTDESEFRKELSKYMGMVRDKSFDPFIPYAPKGYLDPYGTSFIRRNGSISSCLLVHKRPSGIFYIEIAAPNDKTGYEDIAIMLFYAKKELSEHYGEKIYIESVLETEIEQDIADDFIQVNHVCMITRAYLGL